MIQSRKQWQLAYAVTGETVVRLRGHPVPSGALKNAIDYLYGEWNNKAAGFVSYGSAGGVRAVEQLRLVMGELQVADVRAQVMLSLFPDFENLSVFKPAASHEKFVNTMLDQVIAWGSALKTMRLESCRSKVA